MELEIFNEANETYATVFTTGEKIIVAFKGTTTMENMKTDLKVKMVSISHSLPSKKGSINKMFSSLDWKMRKFTKGLRRPILQ